MSSITTSTTQAITKSKPLINNPIFPWSEEKLLENDYHPFPRFGHSSCSNAVNNELYFFGGISNGKHNNHVFSIETTTYGVQVIETTGNAPSPRSRHTHIRVGSNLITFGGKLENIEEKPDYNLFVLNLVSKKWTKPSIKGVTPLGRFGHTAVLIGTVMYVFGGCIDGYYLNDLVAFDTRFLGNNEGYWMFIDPINESPPGRTGHVSCAYDGKIYIFGGTDGERCFNDTWYYDTKTKEWIELTCDTFIPVPRESHGSTLVNDVMYVFGGRTKEGKELSDLAAFGINNKRWYMFQKMGPSPGPRYLLTISSSKNMVMIFGGESRRSTNIDEEGSIHILDTSKIKYPTDTLFSDQLFPSQLQMVLSTFPQQKSLPKLRQQQTINDGREIIDEYSYYDNYNTNKIELKARNPDIKIPSSSRPSSRSVNINIATTTTTTRGHLTNGRNSRPSSVIDSNKSLNPNEKIKISKISPQKVVLSGKGENNIRNNSTEISSDKNIRQKNLHINIDENPELTKSSNGLSMGKNELKRQNSTDSVRSIRSIRSIRSTQSLSSPSLRPKGARTLDKMNRVKMVNLGNTETSSNNSTVQVTPSKKEESKSSSKEEESRPPSKKEESKPPSEKESKLSSEKESIPPSKKESKPPSEKGSKPPSEKGSKPPSEKGSKPPSEKGSKPPSEKGSKPPSEKGSKPPSEKGSKPPSEKGSKPPSEKGSKPPSEKGSKPPSEKESKSPPARPPRRRLYSEPSKKPTKPTEHGKIMHSEEKDLTVTNTPTSISSLKISTSSDGTTQLSSLERENFLERLSEAEFKMSEMRKREKLYQAEIDLARKAGYIPKFSFNDVNNEDVENIIDINKFIDVGEPGSEKFKVIEAIIKLSQQLQKAKETIANQERLTSQKISDFERLYTASLEETAYFKAKFAALMNEYETERLAKTANAFEKIKQKLNEKTQKLEESSKDVEDAKNKFELVREVISDKVNPEPNIQGIISSRFREIAARCDELEALHEMAHKELQASLSKYKESIKNAQETSSLENKLENATMKSQEQLVDIKNRLSQVEMEYQVAVEYTTSTEQILDRMREELIQSKLEMEKLNEKLISVENHNEELENRLKELQNSMNSHSNIRNSILQEYADQQMGEQQMNFEKEKESLYQKIQDLQTKISIAQDEKSLMDQGYEALRRIYESLRKQNEILKKSNEMLTRKSLESEKKGVASFIQ